MDKVILKEYVKIRTGKLDANASEEDGSYPFFTCAREISRINIFAFDCECVLVAGNGELNVKYYEGKFNAYQRTYVIESVDKNVLSVKYLYYFIDSYIEKLRNGAIGGVIKYIKLNHLTDIELPLPDIETQNKIIAILDKAKTILDKREETIQKYDNLLRATFLEMFGDPVINPNKWKIDSLMNYGALKNGLNYSRDESGNKIKCLGVGDFKSFWKLTNTSTLSSISLNKQPSDDYFLKNEDLVFVRSNGNKELVGRCIVVYPNEEKVTFSGFCIRYRATSDKINMTYLTQLFREPNFKKAMLQNGRGANIQNISQQLLEALKIPIPPIDKQKEFASRIGQFELVLGKLERSYYLSKQLLNSLSLQVFSEKIIIDIDAELEALINAVDLDKKDEENQIDTVINDITFIQRLIDKLSEQEFEDKVQYDKAKYILFRIMKEEADLVKQIFKGNKVQLTLQNETT